MQSFERAKPPLGIVFDSDMNSIDDVLALALLYGFDGKNEARVASISVSNSNLKAAAFSDVITRFYMLPVKTPFGTFSRTLPIGLSTEGKPPEDTPMLVVPLSKQTPDGKPVYETGIRKLNDTAEVSALIRNAFTAQHDQNCAVVLTGPATNLAKVLDLYGAKDWIVRKVRFLCLAGGSYLNNQPESNIKTDIAAAKKLFAEWPTPIVASGSEIGDALLFPGASIEKDFAWSTAHPVVDAYRAYKPMPYDAPAWDMTPVLYAVRPQEGYFKLSDPGTITVLDDGRTKFTPSPQGKHRYLILDPAQKQRIMKTLVEVASAKPVPRQFRLRQQQQQKQQNQEPKQQDQTPKPPEAQ